MGIKTIFKIYIVIFVLILTSYSVTGQSVKVGVALPTYETANDKSASEVGNSILSGIKYALETYNKTTKQKVQGIAFDTRRDPQAAIQIFENFVSDNKVICAIGPVYSSMVQTVANIGNENRFAIISPTATGDSLAELNNYVFQLNPSYKVRGELMADYIIYKQKKTNIAIISEKIYGSNFADPFRKYAEKNGGNIIYKGYYDKKALNIKPIIDSLIKVIISKDLFLNVANMNQAQQQKLMNAGISWNLVDSLIKLKYDVSIYYLFGKDGWKKADSLGFKPYKLKDVSKKFIQGYLDAIYIPISNSAEISMIVPALFSDGLSGFIAGNGDWNNPEILEENKVYIKNLLFESEYYPEGSNEFEKLKKSTTKVKYNLNKNFLFGYDAMKLILDLIAQGNKTRESIYTALQNVSNYDAIKSKITINNYRINSELNILTYADGLQLVERYRLEDK